MTARSKIREARFFLEQLRSAGPLSENTSYYVSACVAAIYGALNHLLYDYAVRFWAPRFDTNDFIDLESFKLIARITDDSQAMRFADWYGQAMGRMHNDADASALLRIRRMETHREDTLYFLDITQYDRGEAVGPFLNHRMGRPVVEVIENTLNLVERYLTEAQSLFGSS